MKISKITLAVAAALFSSAAMADSWVVTQTVTPGGDTTITQQQSSNSYQALNTLNSGAATFEGGTAQSVDTTNGTITLEQSDGTGTQNSGSTQAANLAIGGTLGDTAALTQSETGGSAISLNQTTSGTGNTQAFNAAIGDTVTKLEQSITTGAISLTQNDNTGANNTQAGNLIDASANGATTSSTAGDVQQEITTALTLTQGTGGAGPSTVLQAGNALITGGTGGAVTQDVAAPATLSISQSGASSSHQAANYAGAKL